MYVEMFSAVTRPRRVHMHLALLLCYLASSNHSNLYLDSRALISKYMVILEGRATRISLQCGWPGVRIRLHVPGGLCLFPSCK